MGGCGTADRALTAVTSPSRECPAASPVPISIDFSAMRAERLADLTELNVATAGTSAPPAVTSDEIVTRSAT